MLPPIGKPKKVEKEWGYELWLANNEKENYCAKILHIDGASWFSMHFHANKHETFYILKGECTLTTIDTQSALQTEVELREGDTYEINRLVPHQIRTGMEGCDIIEASTFHSDDDSHRVWKI